MDGCTQGHWPKAVCTTMTEYMQVVAAAQIGGELEHCQACVKLAVTIHDEEDILCYDTRFNDCYAHSGAFLFKILA